MAFPSLTLASPYMTGEAVKRLQRLLKEHGYYGGAIDGEFGPVTASACRTAKWRLGYPRAKVKGNAGDVLVSYLAGTRKLTALMRLTAWKRRRAARLAAAAGGAEARDKKFREAMIRAAIGELGVKEEPAGSNDGPRVRVYQNITRAFRAAWCASFQCWIARVAGYTGPLPKPYPAWCPEWEDKARKGEDGWKLISKHDLKRGDQVLYSWSGGEAEHIGIVTVPPDANGDFTAIEGNTAMGADSNGGEVMERRRNISQVRYGVRIPAPGA